VRRLNKENEDEDNGSTRNNMLRHDAVAEEIHRKFRVLFTTLQGSFAEFIRNYFPSNT
jgi:hypothetical protein